MRAHEGTSRSAGGGVVRVGRRSMTRTAFRCAEQSSARSAVRIGTNPARSGRWRAMTAATASPSGERRPGLRAGRSARALEAIRCHRFRGSRAATPRAGVRGRLEPIAGGDNRVRDRRQARRPSVLEHRALRERTPARGRGPPTAPRRCCRRPAQRNRRRSDAFDCRAPSAASAHKVRSDGVRAAGMSPVSARGRGSACGRSSRSACTRRRRR